MSTFAPQSPMSARLMRITAPAKQAVALVRKQVAANPRLGIGLALIPLFIWAYLLIALVDGVAAQRRSVEDARSRLARAEATAADSNWSARKAEMEGLQASLEQRLWNEGSEGLVQAEFLETMGRVVRAAGLGRPQIRIERETSAAPALGLKAISATISADFTPEALNALFISLGSAEKLTVVRNLRIQRQPLARVDALLTGFLVPPGATVCKGVGAK